MIVMVLEKVSASARGELTRWLLEVRSGVFVGHVNARVRDRLWKRCAGNSPDAGVLQIWNSNTEQKFQMRMSGDTSRYIVEEEGIQLIKQPGVQPKFIKRNVKKHRNEESEGKIEESSSEESA